jgi:hypothetical protein
MGGACSAHGGKIRNASKIWLGSPKGKDHAEDLRVDGRIVLKCILGKQGLAVWIGFIWLMIGTDGGLL